MKVIKKSEKITNLSNDYDYQIVLSDMVPKNELLFDIETTGVSPKTSIVYLIGVAWFEGQTVVFEQFFAETPDEEPYLLLEFQKLAIQFDTLISFNGTGFDIPFLKSRMEKFDMLKFSTEKFGIKKSGIEKSSIKKFDVKKSGIEKSDVEKSDVGKSSIEKSDVGKSGIEKSDIEDDTNSKNQMDLYKDILSYKHIFHLENYKQKTVEKFFGIDREEDDHTGGELIPVYKDYQKQKGEHLLHMLLQHNYQDLLGLTRLLSFYSIDAILKGEFTLASCTCSTYRKLNGQMGKECQITCQTNIPSPVTFSCNNDDYYLHVSRKGLFFRIPVYQGSLKFFYPNYKDYYYLPEEDMAIHKNVAAYVDKAHRTKAKAANCYQKKTGTFLPQYMELKAPAFYKDYKDPISFFEWQEDDTNDPLQLKDYCIHILQTLKQGL